MTGDGSMGWVRRNRWLVAAGTVVVLGAAAALVVVLWPSPPAVEEPRARDYRDYDVCVLTPAQGLADPQAAAVWAGAQEVSLARSVRVRYQQVTGEQTPARAAEYLASLVQQECDVIVAVGAAPVAAAAADETNYSDVAILTVGDEIDDSSSENTIRSTIDALMGLVPSG